MNIPVPYISWSSGCIRLLLYKYNPADQLLIWFNYMSKFTERIGVNFEAIAFVMWAIMEWFSEKRATGGSMNAWGP